MLQQVIVSDGEAEIHGYALSLRGGRVNVVWEVASGQLRQRSFPAGKVFLPSAVRPWAGVPIAVGRLPGRPQQADPGRAGNGA
ncbi:hypothetical protein J2W20_003305 [Sinomonas atrocyanea]|jgi:hypothetical protein|nr:hypothetical protein [Sinomonas atrocyanea]MDR6623556.1 hypothetical protein [Sinomonas atrocyanea]